MFLAGKRRAALHHRERFSSTRPSLRVAPRVTAVAGAREKECDRARGNVRAALIAS
jgi:hypothetical protein